MYAILLSAVLLSYGSSPQETGQTACPADHPASRAITERFLSHPAYAKDRRTTGTAGYAASNVRLLTDSRDLSMCLWMRRNVQSEPGWVWSAYEVGTVYIVASRPVSTDGSYVMGFRPLVVLDTSGKVLGAYPM